MDSKIALSSWSGGKDSCLAYYKAVQQGYKVNRLLNFISRESKRACFHGIEARLMQLQADLIGVELVQKETTADMEKYEEEFKAAVAELRGKDTQTMVFGDIYLLEHQSWIERVCADIKIGVLEPLWNQDPENLVHEFIDLGFKAIIVSCKADIMGKEFIGRTIDKKLVEEFKKRGVCPCGEKGEYHTLVIDGPIFKRPIKIKETQPILKEGFWKHWFLDIKDYN